MNQKIYVLKEHGKESYDPDYIWGVFSSQEKAETFARRLELVSYAVSEHYLDILE